MAFGFGKKKASPPLDTTPMVNLAAPVATQPVSAPVSTSPQVGGISLKKETGKISLEKGGITLIKKTPMITARCEWSSNTDYDLYLLALMKDGRQLVVSTFGSKAERKPTPSILNGAIRHLGDVKSGGGDKGFEIIEIKMTDDIEAVVPVAYSAQSNGGGSFIRYKVSLSLDNGQGDTVTIDANNAKDAAADDTVYSVAIGVIRNSPDGVIVEYLEAYSAPGSERRPTFIDGKVVMDTGADNLYKR